MFLGWMQQLGQNMGETKCLLALKSRVRCAFGDVGKDSLEEISFVIYIYLHFMIVYWLGVKETQLIQ